MTKTRAGHSATLLANGTVLIAGGFVAYGPPIFQMVNASKTAEIFDPTTGTFTKTKSSIPCAEDTRPRCFNSASRGLVGESPLSEFCLVVCAASSPLS